MAQNKYIIFKTEDAQAALTQEQKQQLMNILTTVNSFRKTRGKSTGDLFFVLNMKDIYALPAMDTYIAGITSDRAYETNPVVRATLEMAVDIKQTAAMTASPKLPD